MPIKRHGAEIWNRVFAGGQYRSWILSRRIENSPALLPYPPVGRLPNIAARKSTRPRHPSRNREKTALVPTLAAMLFRLSDAAGAVAGALPPGDADATGASPLARSRLISRRGQAKSSARPAGADKASP